MMPSYFDVAIAGGGPGGAATALSLLSHAPFLSVVLIEATRYDSHRVGETLPPPARAVLEHLGVWDTFHSQGHHEVHGTSAAWGGANPLDNDFFYMPANVGWHLDRTAFDAMLAGEAQGRGATLILDTRVRDSRRTGEGWRLQLSTGDAITARFIVDATGGAGLARRGGARFVEADRLVGIAGFFDSRDGDPQTLVEAFEHGWWYTAGLPKSRRIVVCMTDADVARGMRMHEPKEWRRTLAAMPHVGAMVGRREVTNTVMIRSASSRRLEPVMGNDWLAVGDAASRFDPLSSQGIFKALRSGIFASYAIGDLLGRGDRDGLKRFSRYVVEEFKSYTEIRRKYYCAEQRWPASEFWRRRQGIGPAEVPSALSALRE
jgi:2-polyprenyl-6-methoxyphenol hydroxylase-like FAD-dependent oxidoreductase